ncbi:MAG: ribonuclease HI family protein [Candidatus Aminicenantes bacterium]|nr:ribonuclease HI family protein [Candidatus Aminicenantes bacterium]
MTIRIYIDGSSRGNPGEAGYGFYVTDADGKELAARYKYLGYKTNNYAEYQALLAALKYAIKNNYPRVEVYSDSLLLVNQIKGLYKVKSRNLMPLFLQALRLMKKLPALHICHLPHQKNRLAHNLAHRAIELKARIESKE